MAVRVIGLVGREVAGVDVAPFAVLARTGSRAGPLQELDDARMRGGEPPGELHRVTFVVPALGRHRVLVVRRDRRQVLVDASRTRRPSTRFIALVMTVPGATSIWSTSTPIAYTPFSFAAAMYPRPEPPATWKRMSQPLLM